MNNIKLIKENIDFLRPIFVNILNEDIELLYIYIFEYFLKKKSIILKKISSKNDLTDTNSLFGEQIIYLFKANSKKNLDEIIKLNLPMIYFLDYKTFKTISKEHICLNSYNFKKDISLFLKQELNIENQSFVEDVCNHPEYLYSEIGKYLINSRFEKLSNDYDNKSNILDLRIKYFKNKNLPTLQIQNLYELLKNEVTIKKFSFLTY